MDEALRLRPDFADALCMGGYMLSECGKPERRCASIGARSSSTPRWSSPMSISASSCSPPADSLRRWRVRSGDALAPDDPDAWCSRAGALRELGRLEESVEAAKRALALRPDFPEAAINLGNALLKLDRTEEAFDAYLRASRPGPCLAKALLGQGSGVAQSWPLLGGHVGVRRGRGARQPRGCCGQGLPHADARRLRART